MVVCISFLYVQEYVQEYVQDYVQRYVQAGCVATWFLGKIFIMSLLSYPTFPVPLFLRSLFDKAVFGWKKCFPA